MELSELTAYADEKYRIREQHKWTDFPGFSVLCHPQTGKWVALLMRQWDTDTGTEIERCDLKCGNDILRCDPQPCLGPAIRMHGSRWLGIAFDERTERELVFQLFDKAVRSNAPHGYTIVLGPQLPSAADGRSPDTGADASAEGVYTETALPSAASGGRPPEKKLPERLREMRRLYEYGRESDEARARNFYRQAVFMQDYEDDCPWSGNFVRYFPTYQDLTVQQLRGYFSWRTRLRRGNVQPIATSAAYLYVYELLNGVGVRSPEEGLQKLREFEAAYLDTGIGDGRMRANLRRWMLEYAVLNDLPAELAREAAPPELIARDTALAVLREAGRQPDEELFRALCTVGGKKLADSPVLAAGPERGARLFCEAWRAASAYCREGKELFSLCFGERTTRRWYPLSNAVYLDRSGQKNRDYELDGSRSYRCRHGVWQVTAYEKPAFDRARFQGFLHEADARLRRFLKTGRYLKESPADEWAVPYIDAVIEAEKRAMAEAARPKITIDLSGLEKIRRDAAGTRDSLLTEEEMEDTESPEGAEESAGAPAEQEDADLPLDRVQVQILRALLRGEDARPILKANRLMPSIAADFINEALFDEVGDTVLLCEDDRLILVGDYIEEIGNILGENRDG